MAKMVITPAMKATLSSALYDLNNTEAEMELLRNAGVDVTEAENIRKDLRNTLMAYLQYAEAQKRGA